MSRLFQYPRRFARRGYIAASLILSALLLVVFWNYGAALISYILFAPVFLFSLFFAARHEQTFHFYSAGIECRGLFRRKFLTFNEISQYREVPSWFGSRLSLFSPKCRITITNRLRSFSDFYDLLHERSPAFRAGPDLHELRASAWFMVGYIVFALLVTLMGALVVLRPVLEAGPDLPYRAALVPAGWVLSIASAIIVLIVFLWAFFQEPYCWSFGHERVTCRAWFRGTRAYSADQLRAARVVSRRGVMRVIRLEFIPPEIQTITWLRYNSFGWIPERLAMTIREKYGIEKFSGEFKYFVDEKKNVKYARRG